MELKGLKINILGDSITEGYGCSNRSKRFTDLIAAQTGAITRNYGISGTRIALQQVSSGNEQWEQPFVTRVEGMDPDADIIVIFGGTNDYGHGDAPFGDFADRTAGTFIGALHVLYTQLLEKYPAAQIVILTPLHRDGETNRNSRNKNMADYAAAIRQVAEYYSLPVLNLWATYGVQPAVPVMKTTYMPDGLHPNDAGHVILARKIIQFMQAL